MTLEERLDTSLVLERRDRAGRIHERAARPQPAGRGIEQLVLGLRELANLALPLPPARVGPRLKRSEVRARGIEEDTVEQRFAVLCEQLGRIAGAHLHP